MSAPHTLPENPRAFRSNTPPFHYGMTLRDWFAGQALVGLLASPMKGTREQFAGGAYDLANAMLVAREQAEKA